MTDGMIRRIFTLQGFWIGGFGTVLGTVIGLALAWVLGTFEIIPIPPEVYFVDRLPVSVRAVDVLKITSLSITIAFLATIYPALQASRLQPVDAIRQ
jgi:lipoprotein-releasing system permease protein